MKTLNLLLVLGAVAMALLVAIIYISIAASISVHRQSDKNSQFVACLTNWANETAERSTAVTGLNLDRQNTLDTLMRDFAGARNPNPTPEQQVALRKQFFVHFDAFVKASDAYRKALKEHPLPKSPKLACPNPKK